MTIVRFAYGGANPHTAKALSAQDPADQVSVLVSYVYLDQWLKHRDQYGYLVRDWVVDSGAFSVWNAGKTIDLQEYIDRCAALLAGDRPPVEIFGLDVIGDWAAGLRNVEEMCRQGVDCIPAYHLGEPESVLVDMAKAYPKIALGGMVQIKDGKAKLAWAEQCFARVWPKRIHGFGVSQEYVLSAIPFDTVDMSSWAAGHRYGRWASYGADIKTARNPKDTSLRPDVEHYLQLERRLRSKWGATLDALEAA